jgi:hypothetical protein
MRPQGISHARLMRESEERVASAAYSSNPQEQIVAGRVLENAGLWCSWAAEHHQLLRDVATQRRPDTQIAALKSKSFVLIHRKALFEYLSEREVRGQKRRRVLALFHRSRCYTDAVIAEHGQYVRSACSYICTSHLGSAVIRDGAFEDPFNRYEHLYSEYFRTFCDVALAGEQSDDVASQRALLPYLKYQLTEQRQAILSLPRSAPRILHDSNLRRPTGDTLKLERPQFDGGVRRRPGER